MVGGGDYAHNLDNALLAASGDDPADLSDLDGAAQPRTSGWRPPDSEGRYRHVMPFAESVAPRRSGLAQDGQDPSVRPQDDLYAFANGSWVRNTRIPTDLARFNSFEKLRAEAERNCHSVLEDLALWRAAGKELSETERKLADMYRSFTNENAVEAAGREPLRQWLDDAAGVTAPQDLLRLLGMWGRHGIEGIVTPIVDVDGKDSSRYVVYLEQSGLGLPDESFYREQPHASVRAEYVSHIARMFDLASIADPVGSAKRAMAIETQLAEHHWDLLTCRDAVKTYTRWPLSRLAKEAPGGDWEAWAASMRIPSSALDGFIVRQPSYVVAASAALRERPIEEWRDWLRWRAIRHFAPYLSSRFVDQDFSFYGRTLSGTSLLGDRWKRGVELVDRTMGEGLGRIYVKRHFPQQARALTERMTSHLVEAFWHHLCEVPWMGDATRDAALAKIRTLTVKVGHPRTWRDYGDLDVDPNDLVGNVCRAALWELDREMGKVSRRVDAGEWSMTPQTVNAYYNALINEIVLPAAILQPPFFDLEADDAVNYGAIGAVIGHEIGHGFDDQGSRYDEHGELRDWWTPDDRSRFDQLGQALIAQFDELEPSEAPGRRVSGALTLGENIGDIVGLTVAFRAYAIATEEVPSPTIDGFSGPQRFFLGWAQAWRSKARREEAIRLLAVDSHAPANCRANVCRNLREFHEAFGVREGDGMWLPESRRVRIF